MGGQLSAVETRADAWTRIPRRDTPIVVFGEAGGEDLAPRAAAKLAQLGYTDVRLLDGGLAGWLAAGGELFIDVNVPSKSFGEWVEAERHTPSLSAQEVQALIDAKADVVIVDARRFDEYQTMNIPTSTSVPGAETVLRVRALAPNPATQVIVNCAGRTRSIIGTQSLVNAGLPNPVAALRNGTIGWTLAGQTLERGAARRFPDDIDATQRADARRAARAVAERAGVPRIALADVAALDAPGRTLYRFDVRTPEEYEAGHLPGFLSTPGGQLVQETDHHAAVRGARIVLADDDGVRADMTASWLAQMGWDVRVVEPEDGTAQFGERGQPPRDVPATPSVAEVSPATLAGWLKEAAPGELAIVDVTASANYVKRHIPGRGSPCVRSCATRSRRFRPRSAMCSRAGRACWRGSRRTTPARCCRLRPTSRCSPAARPHGSTPGCRSKAARRIWPHRASTATGARTKAPTTRRPRCRRISTGSTDWSIS